MVGTHTAKIFHYECGGLFHFKGNILSIPPKPVEISHEWVLPNINYQEPEHYTRLFDESEEGPFEVPPGCTTVGAINPPLVILSCMSCRKSILLVCYVN